MYRTWVCPIPYIPAGTMHNSDTMTEPAIKTPDAGGKKREELTGRVLVTNDLVHYQDGTVASRMIVFKKTGTITLFAFDAGEGLSEHSAPFDAVLMVTDGEAEVTIAGSPFTIHTGEMIILPADRPHAIQARQRFKMTLTMIRE